MIKFSPSLDQSLLIERALVIKRFHVMKTLQLLGLCQLTKMVSLIGDAKPDHSIISKSIGAENIGQQYHLGWKVVIQRLTTYKFSLDTHNTK